jgi:hypothetical protein
VSALQKVVLYIVSTIAGGALVLVCDGVSSPGHQKIAENQGVVWAVIAA